MEGFVNIRLRPWLRRLITRLVAIIPAIIVVSLYGERGTGALLILSQVDSEPAAAVRGISARELHEQSAPRWACSSRPRWVQVLAWTIAVIIAALNVWLLYQTFFG